MSPIEWSEVWSDVARRMARHREAGRAHLLTEDVLRFESVLALEAVGVDADRLTAEVLTPSLAGGKLDLVVEIAGADGPAVSFNGSYVVLPPGTPEPAAPLPSI